MPDMLPEHGEHVGPRLRFADASRFTRLSATPTAPRALLVLIAAQVLSTVANAQCTAEFAGGYGFPGFDKTVSSLYVWDDALGPALYAGGQFDLAGRSPDGVAAAHIARWDGNTWTPLGAGVSGVSHPDVYAMTRFDDGHGESLFVAGLFATAGGVRADNIARWDGARWHGLGSLDDWAAALAVFDDGGGAKLYVGGAFTTAAGKLVHHIACWDGQNWSDVGGGMNPFGYVIELVVHDDGSGPALYAGGEFTEAGGVAAHHVARWNGQQWSPVGTGVESRFDGVQAMTVFDAGDGTQLYVGGDFHTAGGKPAKRVARWDGLEWHPVGDGLGGDTSNYEAVDVLFGFDDGGGPRLYATGFLSSQWGVHRFEGDAWVKDADFAGAGYCMAAYDDGRGTALYAGGGFVNLEGCNVNRLAMRRAGEWSAVGNGLDAAVECGIATDFFGEPTHVIGGDFKLAGGRPVNYVARWDRDHWSSLGTGMNGAVHTLLDAPDPLTGQRLIFAGGYFTTADDSPVARIATWDGGAWRAVGQGFGGGSVVDVRALAVFDAGDGPRIIAGGSFSLADGIPASNIAVWNGAAWSALRGGVYGGAFNPTVRDLQVFDDGGGAALYACGSFSHADGVFSPGVARWDGQRWSAVGTGLPIDVFDLAVFDDGNGPELYAGGDIFIAGIQQLVARWTGSEWVGVGGGLGGSGGSSFPYVDAIEVFDFGDGPELVAGGAFTLAGGQTVAGLARWNGVIWSGVLDGVSHVWPAKVVALCALDSRAQAPPVQRALLVGGHFSRASGVPSSHVARLSVRCFDACDANCDGSINGFDVDPFVALLTGGAACAPGAGDANLDGTVNAADIDAFLQCLSR
ncbi:MAG: hypothetical protein CHACPFDD_00738 [Phycisphaerae bacterium]|nr:hypothetical protein [Phycisphaerae bacterium]